ncbi:MAG: CAP domain-containing protein [Actinomycetota bacterium]
MKSKHPLLLVVSVATVVLLLIGITIGAVDALAAGDEVESPGVAAPVSAPLAVPQSEPTSTTSTTSSTTTTSTSSTTTTSTSSTTTTVAPAPQKSVPKTPAPTTTTTAPTVTTTTVAPATTTTTTTVAPTTTTTAPARVAGYDASAEGQFVSLVNNLRAAAGVPALTHVGELRSYARGWSKHMGETGVLSHSNLYNIPGPWASAAENVAVGPTVDSTFGSLRASSGHYANMVNASFTEFGVGVWADADGTLWVTHVFRG